MSACERCSLEDKLLQCCGSYPMTGEKRAIMASGCGPINACPHLCPQGMCGIYEHRPQACREFFCDSYTRLSLIEY